MRTIASHPSILTVTAISVLAVAGCKRDEPRRAFDAATVRPDEHGVFTTILPLGDHPVIPAAFGDLRPWMTWEQAEAVRPPAFGGRWTLVLVEEPEVRIKAQAPPREPRIHQLAVYVERADLRARLEAAWGVPAVVVDAGEVDPAACWFSPAERLRACFREAENPVPPVLTFSRYTPIAEAVAPGGAVDPIALAGRLGKTGDELRASVPDVVSDPVLGETALEEPLPAGELATDLASDHVTYHLDAATATVSRIVVAFAVHDDRRHDELAELVRAAAARAAAPDLAVEVHAHDRRTISLAISRGSSSAR